MNYDATWPGGTRVRFRTLTWKEFQHFSTLPLSKPARNLAVYQACLLSGPSPDQVPAGVVAWIGCEQIDQSPFGSKFKILNQYLQLGRNWLGSSYIHQAQALVAGTLHYTPEGGGGRDAETFFKRWAAAELLVGKRLEPADPAKTEKERKEDAFERPPRERRESRQQPRGQIGRKNSRRQEAWEE